MLGVRSSGSVLGGGGGSGGGRYFSEMFHDFFMVIVSLIFSCFEDDHINGRDVIKCLKSTVVFSRVFV